MLSYCVSGLGSDKPGLESQSTQSGDNSLFISLKKKWVLKFLSMYV